MSSRPHPSYCQCPSRKVNADDTSSLINLRQPCGVRTRHIWRHVGLDVRFLLSSRRQLLRDFREACLQISNRAACVALLLALLKFVEDRLKARGCFSEAEAEEELRQEAEKRTSCIAAFQTA